MYDLLLKQKHKILNLDDAEDGNLIHTSDEDKTTDEELQKKIDDLQLKLMDEEGTVEGQTEVMRELNELKDQAYQRDAR